MQFKEKLHLSDSVVPDTDKIPETVRITVLQQAVQKNPDLRQIHVLDSVWRSKIGSTGKFTFELYYVLLWNAAYQHDLNNAAGQKKRQAFISQQVDSVDESNHDPGEDTLLDQDKDDSSPYSIFQSSFNSSEPQKPSKVFIPNQLWCEFPEAAKKLIIEYNKKVKVVNHKHFFNGGNPKPKPTLGKPNPKPQQVHFHENDHTPGNPHSGECLTDGGIDPSDIDTVMSAFKAKSGKSSQYSSRNIKVHQDMSLLEPINPPITWLIGETMEA